MSAERDAAEVECDRCGNTVEEMGDVLAAITFVAEKRGIYGDVVARSTKKLGLFRKWDADPDNNADGIDADTTENGGSPKYPAGES